MNENENATALLEAEGLLNEAQELIAQGKPEEASAKIALAKEKIKLPIGGGTNGPIRK